MSKQAGRAALAAVFLSQGLLAQTPGFRYEREVTPGGKGPNRLELDVPLLSGGVPFEGGSGLSDLRLYAKDGREIPYLLVDPPEPLPNWVAGRIAPILSTKTTSGFEVDLGRTVQLDRLRLGGLPTPHMKRLRLEGSGDRQRWVLLVAEGTLFDLPEEGLRRDFLEFPTGDFRFLRLTWDDTRSGRLEPPRSAWAREAASAPKAPPLRARVAFERRESEPGKSRFRLRLGGARLPIEAFELEVSQGDLLRDARVTEPRLPTEGTGRLLPTRLGAARLRRAVRGDVIAEDLRIPVLRPQEAEIDLEIENGSNPPLELQGVTAVFARLPVLYFESADGQPLVARFGARTGASRPAPPHYDLEAAREVATKAVSGQGKAAEARWGERRDAQGAAHEPEPQPMGLLGSGAVLDVKRFRISREIPTAVDSRTARPNTQAVAQVASGLVAVPLDAAVLSVSPSLDDVRIVDAEGRQVPYLVESLAEPLVLELAKPERTQNPAAKERTETASGTTFYRIALPYRFLPEGKLTLTTNVRVFDRLVELFETPKSETNRPARRGSPFPNRRASFSEDLVPIASARWIHNDPEQKPEALCLSLPALTIGELLVAIHDGDNAPLPIESPKLLLPAHRLRFFRESKARLRLVYGDQETPRLSAPRYDIALLAPRLLGAPADEVRLPHDELPISTDEEQKAVVSGRVFWGILVAAIGALLVLVVRLVRRGAEG